MIEGENNQRILYREESLEKLNMNDSTRYEAAKQNMQDHYEYSNRIEQLMQFKNRTKDKTN